MSNEINIDKLFEMAEEDIEKSVTYELESDNSNLAKQLTTRYAGAHRMLYKNYLSVYNRVVQAIL